MITASSSPADTAATAATAAGEVQS